MTVIDFAEKRQAFERLGIAVAGVLRVRRLEHATAADVRAIAQEIQRHGPLVEEGAYLLGLDGRSHADAAVWARAMLSEIAGAREAVGRLAA